MSWNEPLREMRALVTGAASGIGRACARELAAQGASVGLLDRDTSVADVLARADGHAARRVDVTDPAAMRAAIATVGDTLGGIDIVVGCAGISGPFGKGVGEIEPGEWDEVIAVNLTAQFLLVKYALPLLRASDAPAIVFLGSDSGFVSAPGMVPYCASKGGLVQLTRSLSVDLAGDGIRVCSVCPSVVDTPLSRGDLGGDVVASGQFPVQAPEQVARHVCYLAAPESATLSGVNLVSDFGYSARCSFPA